MSKQQYRVVDLFSGCGGISEGFALTGHAEIIGAIDFDKSATATFQANFPNAKVLCGDITKISVEETGFCDVDILVGGPPCQGFSRLNYWERDKDNDPRNTLFLQYLRFVKELKPKAILIENVKQILTDKNGFVPKTISTVLNELGYNVSYEIVCAADYGVPQTRHRAIFVAIRKEIGKFDFSILDSYKQRSVTVEDAISDIEAIEDSSKAMPQGTVFTLGSPKTEYQRLMQTEDRTLHNHLIYYPAENVQKMMEYVPEGGNWRKVPPEMFKSQRDNRYTNYLRRLKHDAPSITIDTGHNVYFHPKFNRVPTIRESARLQSFPDKFIFTGKKGEQFRQVGNAVPPLMAKALALAIMKTLEKKENFNEPKFKLLDLFCGAGGLSLGFEKAGFSVAKAIDIDEWSIETYNHNRLTKVGEVRDVTSVDKEFINSLGQIDGMIGGPPCQGFSTAGQRILDDERNKLYREYFRILEQVRPKFFVIENVTGILNFAKGLVKDDILARAQNLGYTVSYTVVDTSTFGVPQIRKRVLFVGFLSSICKQDFIFPKGEKKAITIKEAIGDLPSFARDEDNTKYPGQPQNEYQEKMRSGMTKIFNHTLSKHSEDTKKIISMVPEGGSIMDLPVEQRGGRNYHALLRKMDRNKPALCIDTGHRTYFHYEEARIPSTREVARLQSFPDSYIFVGPRNEQQKQVGNAVPPILAETIAKAVWDYLTTMERM